MFHIHHPRHKHLSHTCDSNRKDKIHFVSQNWAWVNFETLIISNLKKLYIFESNNLYWDFSEILFEGYLTGKF